MHVAVSGMLSAGECCPAEHLEQVLDPFTTEVPSPGGHFKANVLGKMSCSTTLESSHMAQKNFFAMPVAIILTCRLVENSRVLAQGHTPIRTIAVTVEVIAKHRRPITPSVSILALLPAAAAK